MSTPTLKEDLTTLIQAIKTSAYLKAVKQAISRNRFMLFPTLISGFFTVYELIAIFAFGPATRWIHIVALALQVSVFVLSLRRIHNMAVVILDYDRLNSIFEKEPTTK